MAERRQHPSRRAVLARMTAATVGAMAGRGIYDILDTETLPRAAAASAVRRMQEQYLVRNVEVILDNGVTLAIPPLHNDVFTATLNPNVNWTLANLKSAQSRLEKALSTVEAPYSDNAAGLTMVIAWGLPYFRTFTSQQLSMLPLDYTLPAGWSGPPWAVQDAIQFPSDASDVRLEANHVVFKLRSDSPDILKRVEGQLFDDPSSGAYVGDLFQLTSKRIGFLGRGFGTRSIAKTLALQAGVPGAGSIPDNAQLMMGFTSTQTAALGPDNIPSFETLKGMTNQWPSGYFAAGCAMHLSHLSEDLVAWYGGYSYNQRVSRMFSNASAKTSPSEGTVTLPNGPAEVAANSVMAEATATTPVIGHNSALQTATRLQNTVTDNYGRTRTKGTAIPLREDFNTIDNPFHWTSDPTGDKYDGEHGAAGLHFVAFVPTSYRFHVARNAMDGLLPDGTDLRGTTYGLSTDQIGINKVAQATHRQNFLVPPRSHRSFPLVELLK